MIDIKFVKTHPNAKIHLPQHFDDAGFDVEAVAREIDWETGVITYNTGISLEIPTGYFIDVRPRSSIAKTNLILCNGPGTVDSSFRGNIQVKFRWLGFDHYQNWTRKPEEIPCIYAVGDRIAQLVVQRKVDVQFVETDKLSETIRGSGGFGSTGI